MVVITLSIAHTGGSGDMPPKVGCCFRDKVPIKKRKSHPFPCPRYHIFELAINERDKKGHFLLDQFPFMAYSAVA